MTRDKRTGEKLVVHRNPNYSGDLASTQYSVINKTPKCTILRYIFFGVWADYFLLLCLLWAASIVEPMAFLVACHFCWQINMLLLLLPAW